MDNKTEKLLRDAWDIVDSFRAMVMGDILEKTGTLYMSSSFQDLGTACALIGEALGDDSLGCRVITDDATRSKLMAAYQAADMLFRNASAETPWADCCASLMACLYTALNASTGSGGMQQALQSVIQVAQTGIGTIEGLDEAGDDPSWYMNPSGETYPRRRDQLMDAFTMLVPRTAMGDAPGDDTIGGES